MHKIESSLELFEEQYTDFIYFIITGKGLDSRAEARVKELETKYPSRIRRPVLTERQENSLFLLALYEEITSEFLGSNSKIDLIFAKKLLSNIVGQDIDRFILKIKDLAYRETGELPEVKTTVMEVKTSIENPQFTIADFSGEEEKIITLEEPSEAETSPTEATERVIPSVTKSELKWVSEVGGLSLYRFFTYC